MASHFDENSSFQHNNDIIKNLHADDFVYLEKDLEFYEKVIKQLHTQFIHLLRNELTTGNKIEIFDLLHWMWP